VRLFFAVELPSEVRLALGRLRPGGEDRDYRWVDPALMHVTLAFLGEQPEDRLAVLERIGAEAAQASPGGMLRLGDAGSFGAKRAPRVLWVDLGGDVNALLSLQGNLSDGLRPAGFAVEEHEFRAHITLARRREAARGGLPSGWPPQVEHAAFKLEQLTLMQSRLSPRGPTYTPLLQFPLR
jgi:RNA 2',3'-cyclic 3'-phosphodiesterase